jgi:hypothetical protein
MPERYQKEIEDILKQAGDIKTPSSGRASKPNPLRLIGVYIRNSLEGKPWTVSSGRVILVSILFLLSAVVFGAMMPGLTGILGWIGLVLFILGYALFFIKPPRSTTEKRWRGQAIEYESDSWWNKFKNKNKYK